MATGTAPLQKTRLARVSRRESGRPTAGRLRRWDWTPRRRRLYLSGGMVDVAVRELGAVLVLVWPRD